MKHTRHLQILVTVLATALTPGAFAAEPVKTSYYLIGNSLTWDTVPGQLSGDVQWHVDCGVHLRHIYNNPSKPCVTNSTLWPTALRNKQYEVVSCLLYTSPSPRD